MTSCFMNATSPIMRICAISTNCPEAGWNSMRIGRACGRELPIDLADADVAIITSYCPDSLAAGQICARPGQGASGVLRSGYARNIGAAGSRRMRALYRPVGSGRFRSRAEL